MILLDKGISFLNHATPRRFSRRSGIEIGVADGYVGLALLKQHWVIAAWQGGASSFCFVGKLFTLNSN